ncbi:MAG TPA: histidine phosphatase family protein [Streptosporangiaceae bacterium]|jgi:broad specificity phosphatase PhoE
MSSTDPGQPAAASANIAVVHLVRHGEVDNPGGVLYGRLPGFSLSEAGRVMAKAAANFLAGRDITVVRSSPLERAVQTAEPIAAEFDLPIVTDARLIEAANHFEGLRFAVGDGALRKPQHWVYLRNPFRPSWGEPYTEVAARVLEAVRDAAAAAGGHEAVCVSHQLPIWSARRSVEGRRLWHDPRRRQCALGSVTTFTVTDGQITNVQYREPSGPSQPQVAGA